MSDSERPLDADDPPPPRSSIYSNWGLVIRAVVLAAIITGAVYFATAAVLDWVYTPLPN